MGGPDKQLFRPEALETLSSPDKLNQLMTVVTAKDWIPLLAIGMLMATGVAWSVLGSVPSTVTGRGVLVRPRHMVGIETVSGGRLAWFRARAGDAIREGEVIGRLDQAELQHRIEEDKRLLAELESQDRVKIASEEQQVKLQERQNQLETRFYEAQRTNLARGLADAEAVEPLLAKRVKTAEELTKEGLIAEASPDFTNAHVAYRENDSKISSFKAQLQQIDGQLHGLETQLSALVRQTLDSSTARHNQIVDVKTRISAGELQLKKNGDIVSSYSGKVAEVFAAEGQVLTSGSRLLSLNMQDPNSAMLSISYFPAKDGKNIQPGMAVQVIPDNVERNRFGGISAKVVSVSPLPVTREGALNTVGNADMVQGLLTGSGSWVEVTAQLQDDPSTFSGYRWSSSRGPKLKMSPGTTTAARVTLERRAPASYVVPSLREASGI
ncbi:MAG TPA: NHLP bacteriocin system secretion protein [Bryobacteraceae bacterium]|nr:NHLP bacteriocin system secretion protein [Bryobacteraceae bacterium]